MSIIYSYPVKGTPVNDDLVLISDSADSNKTKQVKISSLPGASGSGVDSITLATGTSSGAPLSISAATGAITMTSNAFAGGANIGYVPSAAAAAADTFLKKDGTWALPAGSTYQAGDGIEFDTTTTPDTIKADLKANGGLVIESTELAVDLSASAITGTLAVADGGTGNATLGANSVLFGNGTSAIEGVPNGTAGQVLFTNGAGSPPAFAGIALNNLTDAHTISTSAYIVNVPSGVGSSANNLVVGNAAGTALTSGNNSTLVGYNSGNDITDGVQNTSVGSNSLSLISTGDYNTAVGYYSLYSLTSALGQSSNTAVGSNAAGLVARGTFNTVLGADAGRGAAEGVFDNIVAIGYQAGTILNDSGGNDNPDYTVAVGSESLKSMVNGIKNTAVGGKAGEFSTGDYNVTMGYTAGAGVSGNGAYKNVVAIGYEAGKALTVGDNNTLIGYQAGDGISAGLGNVCIGQGTDTVGGEDDYAIAIGVGATANSGGIAMGRNAVAAANEIAINNVSGAIVSTGTGTSVTQQLKITVNGTAYYIDLKT